MKNAKVTDWSGRVALVTGAGHGIGQATALAMATLGARVHICGRTPEPLEQTRQLAGELAGAMRVHIVDVTDETAVLAMLQALAEEDGHLDILVNNAGMLGPRRPLEEVSLEDWKRTLEVNCTGVFLVTQQAIGLLRKADEPIVINLSSSVGRRGRGGWGPYSVSKHGVEGLTDVFAEELAADQVRVVSLNPGGTATRMRAEAYPEEDPATLPSAADVAETILYLVDHVAIEDSGAKFDSRSLFDRLR
jgi:NAD(P)-dependent dehydrogenase (short-subunit alcohol dehydrogenase family)